MPHYFAMRLSYVLRPDYFLGAKILACLAESGLDLGHKLGASRNQSLPRNISSTTANFVADNFLSRSIINNGKLSKLQSASPVRHAYELALGHEPLIAQYPPIAELFTEPSALVMTGLSCRRVKTPAVSLGIGEIANLVNIFADDLLRP